MPQEKKHLSPNQLVVCTIILSVLAHMIFLSFAWYSKSTVQQKAPGLRISIAPQPTEPTRDNKIEAIENTQIIDTKQDPVSDPQAMDDLDSVDTKITSTESTTQDLNYAKLRSSIDSIVQQSSDAETSLNIGCEDQFNCQASQENMLPLDNDKFGFRAAMRTSGIKPSIDQPPVAIDAVHNKLTQSLESTSVIDISMLNNSLLHLNEMRKQQRYLDCSGEPQDSACKGQINLNHLIKTTVKIVKTLTDN